MKILSFSLFILSVSCIFGDSNIKFIRYNDLQGLPYSVTYDNRSFFINGNRTIFLSGSAHYPRSTPGMWDDIFNKAYNDGLNMIQTYYFMNIHAHKPTDWNFTFNADLLLFLEKAKAANLFVNFRIGIYVCGEWNYGGFPLWINTIPNVTTRSSDPQWLQFMNQSVTAIVSYVRNYFADRGGPIILAQIENEYGSFACDGAIGSCDQNYVAYCGELVSMFPFVPWEMCNGYSANGTINSCNGNDCVAFLDEHGQSGDILITAPGLWTENEAWFQQWGQGYSYNGTIIPFPNDPPSRTPESMANVIIKFFSRGGSLHNYYMWYGGFHMQRSAGTSVANGYAQGGNLNSDGLSNQPYRFHLSNLHHILSSPNVYVPLLSCPAQSTSDGTILEIYNTATHVWINGNNNTLGFNYNCLSSPAVMFIENNAESYYILRWPNTYTNQSGYFLPGYSILILDPNTGNLIFNSTDVPNSPTVRQFTSYAIAPQLQWEQWVDNSVNQSILYATNSSSIPLKYNGDLHVPFSTPSTIGNTYTNSFPYEQLNITEDDTEYMVYTRNINFNEIQQLWSRYLQQHNNNSQDALHATASTSLFITSQISQAFIVFVNGVYSTEAYNNTHNFITNSDGKFSGVCNFTFSLDLSSIFEQYLANPLNSNLNFTLSLISESIGIDNGHGGWVINGTFLTSKGIFSTILLNGQSIFYGDTWTMTSGLQGELLQVFTNAGGNQVSWSSVPSEKSKEERTSCEALIWYRTYFTTPSTLIKKLLTTQPVLTTNFTDSLPRDEVTTTLMLDIGAIPGLIGRGHFYLNGFDLGRYWSIQGYDTTSPGQEYYILPPDLLIPEVENGNLLVLVDVLSGSDVTAVQLVLSELVPI